jgi:hypothetical protein
MTLGVSGLQGLWRRSMIAWPDGTCDHTTRVHWLQGISACIDLRQSPTLAPSATLGTSALPDAAPAQAAAARPTIRAPAANDLTIEQCALLAQQQGFAGRCEFDGSHFVWIRSIDFQPRSLAADAGSLHWEGNVLVETGRDIGYVEHWQREPAAATQPVAAAVLRGSEDGTAAALLRVGPLFMFARDRALAIAGPQALGDYVAAAATLRQAQQLVDCEISFGRALTEGFRITASTLPWRIGALLEPRIMRTKLTTLDCAPNGSAITRRWEIADVEGDLAGLAVADLSSACGS